MNWKSYISTLLFVFVTESAMAHMDFYIHRTYDNILVRVKTGYSFEEIENCLIIGQLAQKFSKELNYKRSIFLDFDHCYVENCDPDYFISFDKGQIQFSYDDSKATEILKKNSIVIRQVSSNFNAAKTLKFVEYAIQNLNAIKASQKRIEYEQNYCQWKINSIDTILTKSLAQGEMSAIIQKTLNERVENPSDDSKYEFISYYWQDGKYNFFSRQDTTGTIILKLNSIYQISHVLQGDARIVFDTDSSFYYLDPYLWNRIPKHYLMGNTFGYYETFQVSEVGNNKVSIYFSAFTKETGWPPVEKTLLYLMKEDLLIYDLDKLIQDYKKSH